MSFYENSYTNDPLSSLDLTNVEAQDSNNGPIPAGSYPVFIEKAEMRTSKMSGNPYLNVQFKVMEGPCQNRCVFDTFALWSGNSTVAKQRFKGLRQALGLNPNVGGTVEELYGQPLVIQVAVTARRDDPNQTENRVRGFKAMPTAKPASTPYAAPTPAPQTPPPAASAPRPSEGGDLPWEA